MTPPNSPDPEIVQRADAYVARVANAYKKSFIYAGISYMCLIAWLWRPAGQLQQDAEQHALQKVLTEVSSYHQNHPHQRIELPGTSVTLSPDSLEKDLKEQMINSMEKDPPLGAGDVMALMMGEATLFALSGLFYRNRRELACDLAKDDPDAQDIYAHLAHSLESPKPH